jgi:hypothetical protein
MNAVLRIREADMANREQRSNREKKKPKTDKKPKPAADAHASPFGEPRNQKPPQPGKR